MNVEELKQKLARYSGMPVPALRAEALSRDKGGVERLDAIRCIRAWLLVNTGRTETLQEAKSMLFAFLKTI